MLPSPHGRGAGGEVGVWVRAFCEACSQQFPFPPYWGPGAELSGVQWTKLSLTWGTPQTARNDSPVSKGGGGAHAGAFFVRKKLRRYCKSPTILTQINSWGEYPQRGVSHERSNSSFRFSVSSRRCARMPWVQSCMHGPHDQRIQ